MTTATPHPLPTSKHRIEALADGVFAIAMTLLVLELKVPDLPRTASNGEIWQFIRHEGPVFFSFLITFIISGAFWHLHQSLLRELKNIKGPLLALNIAFLMFVSLLPFSTGMLGHFLQRTVGQEVYFANQLILGLLLLMQWRLARRMDLVSDPNTEEASELSGRLLAFPCGAVLAMAIAPFSTAMSFYGFLAVALTIRVVRKRRRRKAH
jgi:uncharacterized membrane protein